MQITEQLNLNETRPGQPQKAPFSAKNLNETSQKKIDKAKANTHVVLYYK